MATMMATIVTTIILEVVLWNAVQVFCAKSMRKGYSVPHVCIFGSADASHPDETHLHSSALTYDFYNPSVGVYHHGSENIHSLIQCLLFTFSLSPLIFVCCGFQEMLVGKSMRQSM
jgi:hypothetical protein